MTDKEFLKRLRREIQQYSRIRLKAWRVCDDQRAEWFDGLISEMQRVADEMIAAQKGGKRCGISKADADRRSGGGKGDA